MEIIVAYDGNCGLCHGFVRFLLSHDHAGRLRYAASDSEAGRRIFQACGQDPNDPMAMVTQSGQTMAIGADAAITAIAGLGGPWRLAVLLRIAPAFIRNAFYRWVAGNRIAWFGRASGCPAPQPEWAGRFLP